MYEYFLEHFNKEVVAKCPALFEHETLEQFNEEDRIALKYKLSKPIPLDELMDSLEDFLSLQFLYKHIPSALTQRERSFCAYPTKGLMYKIKGTTNSDGEVETLLVTLYDSLDTMFLSLKAELSRKESSRGKNMIKNAGIDLRLNFSGYRSTNKADGDDE